MSDEERENYERMAEAAHRDWVEDEERLNLWERIATLSAQLAEAVEALREARRWVDQVTWDGITVGGYTHRRVDTLSKIDAALAANKEAESDVE